MRLRGALFGHFWGPAPGVLFPDSFWTLPGFRARRARETLCGAGPIANEGNPLKHRLKLLMFMAFVLDIFENPYGAPRPTESQNPPATKKEIPKKTENPDYPQKSKRSFPKSKRSVSKSKRPFPQKKTPVPSKVNVKYF